MMRRLFLVASLLIATSVHSAGTTGLETLESFVKGVSSGRAEFSQVVTSPKGDKSRTSSGTFEFLRPNRFKFVYRKPFEQSIVADGQTLWLHDVDLNQVTARNQAQALGNTPAALIASASDLKALQADFALQSAPDKDGLQWVQATPKARDGQLQSVRVGFRAGAIGAAGELAALEILDSFGQRSVLTFTKLQVNAGITADAFRFKPPAGADVLRP